jgi:hypothetical protein
MDIKHKSTSVDIDALRSAAVSSSEARQVYSDWLEEMHGQSLVWTDLDDVKPGTYGRDCGYGSGYGAGYSNGYGYGDGSRYGYGSGLGDGAGYGYGDVYGDGYGYGDGSGYGYGYGDGAGYGAGFGDGSGDLKATTLPKEIASIEIVIARHGWIYAGPVECVGDQIIMKGTVNIRMWGCPLGELAQDPEAPPIKGRETKYDIAGTVKMHALDAVASLECNADKWLPFLKRFASSKNKTSKNKRRKR